jgi:hypothetical protein
MLRLKFLFPLFLPLLTNSAIAGPNCKYDAHSKIVYEGKIESIRSIKRDIQVNLNPKISNIRKCVISLEASIYGKWWPTKGEFMYSPDMSENDACDHAEERAKKKIMEEVIPETLTGEKNIKCDLTNIIKPCKVIIMNTSIGKVKFMEKCEK